MVLGSSAGLHEPGLGDSFLPSLRLIDDEMDDMIMDDNDTSTVDSDLASTASTPGLTSDSGSSATLDRSSIRSGSPARSVYSLTSSLRDASFREVHGRAVNNQSDVYLLPADNEETNRLDTQHHMLRRLMGGILGPVDDALRPIPGVQKAVLDLGTGSAIWAIEMALKYPHCDVVGVDLAPMSTREFPPNCRVEVDDINLGLPHFHNSFDFVHARLIASGITDYCGLIHEIARILRPGGLILVEEWDFRAYVSEDGPAGPDTRYRLAAASTPEHPYEVAMAEWLRLLRVAMEGRGGDVDAAAFLETWIRQHSQFEKVCYKDVWIPTQPHFKGNSEAARLSNELATIMRQDAKQFFQSGQPLLRSHAVDIDEVTRLVEEVERDLDECKKKLHVRMQCTWARRKHNPEPD